VAELTASDLGFAFAHQTPLLDGLNLTVRTGETVVLWGENASGKTTLLRLLAGMLEPLRGTVRIDGTPVAEPRGRVGILFQNPDHQMIAPTVEEEIALGLEFRGTPPEAMRPVVENLLGRFGLEQMRSRSPESLSGGQKQRVTLAAIMAFRPLFLLFDEPDSYLDAPSRRDLLAAVEEIRSEVGMLWTTPNPRRRPRADRLLLLECGRIRELSESELTACTQAGVSA
jgi:energy-coupling factor transporter ATP-binding protein EcfA2